MADVVGGPALEALQEFPFDGCSDPPLLVGSGTLFVKDGDAGAEVEAGNFEVVTLETEGEVVEVFLPGEQNTSALGVYSGYPLIMTGDTFAIRNLERLLNRSRILTVGAEVIPFETVREMPSYEVRFVKTLTLDGCETTVDCPDIEIVLWRAYFDLQISYEMRRGQIAEHLFRLVPLPDIANHPSQPFGHLKLVCPVEGLS